MSEFESKTTTEVGSERGFGNVFAILFLAIGVCPLLVAGDVRLVWVFAGVCLFLLAQFAPVLLSVPNRLWHQFGLLLGRVISPIVMALIYITTFMPIALMMRMFGKDPIKRKFEPGVESYWEPRDSSLTNMKNQF